MTFSRTRIGFRSTLLAGVLMCAGCTVGPDFNMPAAPPQTAYLPGTPPQTTVATDAPFGAAQHFEPGADIPGAWWTLFQSRPLNDLIDHALATNASLDAAQHALRQAQENVYAQQGAFFPLVSAGFNSSRNKTATSAVSPASASGSPYYSLHTAQLSVSFTPDVFGLNARTVESLVAQADNQKFQLEATYLTLTSNLVVAALQEASLRAQIQATEEIIRIDSELTNLLRKQQTLGGIAGSDVAAQETLQAQAEQALPPLQKQFAQQRDLLAALSGEPPNVELPQIFDLAQFQLPLALPVSLPSALVAQRPDVRASAEQLHAASALVGVAVASRLPQFQLSAVGGSQANAIGSLLTPGTSFWTLAGGVTQPIFDAGTLLHKERAAREGFEQNVALYRSTVIAALQNVADALRALEFDALTLKASVAADVAATKSLNAAKLQYNAGATSSLTLLNAQQAYQTTHIALVQAQAGRLADTAALFQALGGGWWNRNDAQDAPRGSLLSQIQ